MLVPDVFRALPESPEKLRLRGPMRLKTVAEVLQWTCHFLCEQLITARHGLVHLTFRMQGERFKRLYHTPAFNYDCFLVCLFVIPPANEVVGVYSDPYVRPFVRPSVRPSLPISNPLLL